MREFQILKPVTLLSGIVALSQEQAEARSAKIEAIGGGLYTIIKKIQFKAGETLSYDGTIDKSFALALGEEPQTKELETDETGDPDGETSGEDFLTVKALGEKLNLSVKETCELLADYDVQASVWNAKVPKETAELVILENPPGEG